MNNKQLFTCIHLAWFIGTDLDLTESFADSQNVNFCIFYTLYKAFRGAVFVVKACVPNRVYGSLQAIVAIVLLYT